MLFISQRIIQVLKEDSALVSLLGNANNIFIDNAPVRKDKYVVVETSVGKDQNNLPADIDTISVTAIVSRTISSAHSVCLSITSRLDDILNKGEIILTDATYKIINFVRDSSSGLEIDNESGEFYYRLTYSYIIDKSS